MLADLMRDEPFFAQSSRSINGFNRSLYFIIINNENRAAASINLACLSCFPQC